MRDPSTTAPRAGAVMPLPLTGLRVLDIASFLAAPLAASILGDFGADVIKVEPPGGDGFRQSSYWGLVGRNKKSVVLDLRRPEGCAVLRELIEKTDVLVENYPTEVLERRGIAWRDLSALNPRLIMLSVSAFGATGPYAGRPGNGTVGEGMAGLPHLFGAADGPPMLGSLALGDGVGAMNHVIGVMMALYWRDQQGGTGQQIDATLYEPVLNAMSQACAGWRPGKAPKRSGSRLAGSAVRNVYATHDGRHLVVSATTDRHAAELMQLSGAVDRSDADARLAAWVAARRLVDALEVLVALRVPAAPINDLDALLADPHVLARGSLIRARDDRDQEVLMPAPSPRLTRSPGAIRNLGAKLGEHNHEVYEGLLGLDSVRMSSLRAQGVI